MGDVRSRAITETEIRWGCEVFFSRFLLVFVLAARVDGASRGFVMRS